MNKEVATFSKLNMFIGVKPLTSQPAPPLCQHTWGTAADNFGRTQYPAHLPPAGTDEAEGGKHASPERRCLVARIWDPRSGGCLRSSLAAMASLIAEKIDTCASHFIRSWLLSESLSGRKIQTSSTSSTSAVATTHHGRELGSSRAL